jgi:hypothetical protein
MKGFVETILRIVRHARMTPTRRRPGMRSDRPGTRDTGRLARPDFIPTDEALMLELRSYRWLDTSLLVALAANTLTLFFGLVFA